MELAPLQLSDYFVHSIQVEALSNYDVNKPSDLDVDSLSVEQKCLPQDDGAKRRYGIDLVIKQSEVEGKNLPYSYELRMFGLIDVLPDDLDEDRMQRLVEINGPSMLFSAAREILRAATGRGPYGPLLIPSTTFYKPSKAKKEKAKNDD
jgi:preprotein translocase subunit SecB